MDDWYDSLQDRPWPWPDWTASIEDTNTLDLELRAARTHWEKLRKPRDVLPFFKSIADLGILGVHELWWRPGYLGNQHRSKSLKVYKPLCSWKPGHMLHFVAFAFAYKAFHARLVSAGVTLYLYAIKSLSKLWILPSQLKDFSLVPIFDLAFVI